MSSPEFSYAAKSDPGRVHELNEDSVGADEAKAIWLVADGMGGHAAGEVASQIARDVILAEVAAGQSLSDAIITAHGKVVEEAAADDARKGMGTTCVAVRITGASSEWCWVGDSRGYLWREGQLSRITKDHSFMQLLIDRQHLTEEQARTHPKRNVVTQVLGYGDPKPDCVNHPLRRGDVLLLCSDGLVDELTDPEMAAVLASQLGGTAAERTAPGGDSPALRQCVDALVAAACEKGGRDNVSAVLVRYDGADADSGRTAGGAVDPGKTTVVRGRRPAAATGGAMADAPAVDPKQGDAATEQKKSGWSWTDWTIGVLSVTALVLITILVIRYLGDS